MGSFASSASGVTINSTSPLSPSNGDLWSNSSNGRLYIYNNSQSKWIEVIQQPIQAETLPALDEDIANYTIPSSVTGSSAGGSSKVTPASYTFVGTWSPYGGGTRERMIDGDFNTNAYEMPYASDVKVVFDFGTSLPRTNLRLKCDYASTSGRGNYAQIQTSPDNVTWTTHHTDYPTVDWLSSFDVTIANPNTTFRYCRVRWVNQQNLHTYFYEIEAYEPTQDVSVTDDNTATHWESQSEANPNIKFDMGSVKKLASIAIYHNSNTTETEYAIQTSPDNSTWTTRRTVLTSSLTAGEWNFIRHNITQTDRYIRIYGNNTGVMAMNQFKYKELDADDLVYNHSHLTINSTDSTVDLDGT